MSATPETVQPFDHLSPQELDITLKGQWTLHELEPSRNGIRRWSAGVNGPVVYMTCDKAIAEEIVARWNRNPLPTIIP